MGTRSARVEICPGLLQMIANQCLKAAPSPEVKILNPVLALNRDANVAVG